MANTKDNPTLSSKATANMLMQDSDEALAVAESRTRSDTIKRLTGQANTLAALLSVIHILEPDYRNDSMATAASIAEELAADVAALVEVAA